MLNNLDLFKVRIMCELIKTESLIGAATHLRVTSSAISQNIRNLEKSLGKPLFIRVGKSIKPTPLAIEITEMAKPFFSDLASLLEETSEPTVELRIGAPPIFGATYLLDRLESVRKKYPGVRICLSLIDTKRITEDLLNGKIEFGFVDSGPNLKHHKEILTSTFANESLVLCCSKEFWQEHLRKNQSLTILKSLAHIPYHREKEGVHKWYLHHYHKVPDLPWSIAVDNPYGVLNGILKGWGLGVIPRNLTVNYENRVRIIDGPRSELKSDIFLAQNKSRIPSKIEKSIISMLLANSN